MQAAKTGAATVRGKSLDFDQLAERAMQLLHDDNLEVSKLRPFFWSLVEAYVDRFQCYPFDVRKALFCHLELNDYPAEEVTAVIEALLQRYRAYHGEPLALDCLKTGPGQEKADAASLPASSSAAVAGDAPRVGAGDGLHDSLRWAAMLGERLQAGALEEEA